MDILPLSHYLDNLLDISNIPDLPNAFNGLQVENTGDIKKIGLAVDICDATIRMAIDQECHMVLVHHGLFWSGSQPIRGKIYKKLSTLIRNNVGLYAAHIPLDIHPLLGNSKVLADLLGLQNPQPFGEYMGIKIGLKGTIQSQPAKQLAKYLGRNLSTQVQVIGERKIESIGLVTGGAGEMICQAVEEGLDAYLTGECDHHHFHEATEGGCTLLLAGHYATETGGVKAIGKHLEGKFGIECEFLHYPTGL